MALSNACDVRFQLWALLFGRNGQGAKRNRERGSLKYGILNRAGWKKCSQRCSIAHQPRFQVC